MEQALDAEMTTEPNQISLADRLQDHVKNRIKDELTGFFIIKDLMNARFTSRIDFLHSPDTPPFKLVDVELYATNIRQAD